ncbi:hypothetical protein J7E87_10455 [Streptomyces sp. ISL-1]|uniref:hypothetical protein n=1 Tax=Streptomyces sp. ISL-1 TaxID=2817657 RepID=UPI001BEB4E94|nr:hypothetical protein [Streptomyces sp. ISL-1]MBT2389842.1 hypothetical protein [Streptomyces sp. ISL-1]
MNPTPADRDSVRSVAQVNAEIRELWSGGVLPEERRPEYERLVVAWARAHRTERAAQGGAGLAA